MDRTISEVLAEGKYLRLVRYGRWESAERVQCTGAVGIAAVTSEGNLLLTEQFRPPVGGPVIELPAGLSGDEGDSEEALEAAARRELLEETGYEAAEWQHVIDGASSAGLTSEVVSLFLARGLRKVGSGGGIAHEAITVHEIPLGEVETWVRRRVADGCRVDYRVFAALYFCRFSADSSRH
jgi:ADP-ribose pyrophosphatase